MTLAEQIKLINDLIREDRDIRICDYLEIVRELDQIGVSSRKVKIEYKAPEKYTAHDEVLVPKLKPAISTKPARKGEVIPDKPKPPIKRPPARYDNHSPMGIAS